MKKIITLLLIGSFSVANAQIIIGDAVGTAAVKTSVLLEFAANQNKGIILPYVRTLPTTPAEGTILLDASTPTSARVKVYNANSSSGTNGWLDLSGQSADISSLLSTQPSIAVAPEPTTAKTIIGADNSAVNGVLVLESTTKAMVLPIVADVQNILSPSAGMMVYVNKANTKRLAVYNGSKWSFWRGEIETVPTVTTATGRVWMDRNLGATQAATSSTDAASYGYLYQWGRLTDAHQIRTSPVSTTLSSTDVPGNGNFIASSSGPNDWRSPQNNNLWQGINGANNPCPSGFRIPTLAEFQAESALFTTQNAAGALNSPLKLPVAGYRVYDGTVIQEGVTGVYWTSTANSTSSAYAIFTPSVYSSGNTVRAYGFSVRCIKN